MKQAEKIEYAKDFLQTRIEEEFPYPFKVTHEKDHFMFRLKNGPTECCARVRQTKEMIDGIAMGAQEQREQEVKRIFEILKAAIEAQESTALCGSSDYEKVKNDLVLRPLNYQYVKEDIRDVPHIRVGDIALVLYAVMSHAGSDYFTAKMRRSQMAGWSQSEKEVLEAALINTSFCTRPDCFLWRICCPGTESGMRTAGL